jgi:translation initiation factor 3 subunit M
LSWSPLVNLLKIICDGSLDDFQSFKSSNENSSIFKENAIQWSDIEYKMKLLTLCSLCGTAANNKNLSYSVIAQGLKIQLDEVEDWIIDAIGQNLIDGSMDQLNSSFIVTRYTHRSFGTNQWKLLQNKLKELRKQVSHVTENIQRSNNTQTLL